MLTILYFIIVRLYSSNSNKSLILTIGDKQYEISLEEDKVVDLREYGKKMKISIKDKKARIIESDCPDKTCIRMGVVGSCGESAVCVPNEVSIHIKCSKSDYDAISK
ncbi:MAG: NusG domain II-containing protein [Deferribacterales bacterium]